MKNDFSCIGFDISCDEDVAALYDKYQTIISSIIAVNGERYEVLRPDGNIELWFYSNKNGVYKEYCEIGYNTSVCNTVTPIGWLGKPNQVPATLHIDGDLCPLNVSLPQGFSRNFDMNIPCKMAITLFPQSSLEIISDITDYNHNYEGKLDSEAIIPLGTFGEISEQSASAMINGVVDCFEEKTNPITRNKYYAITLKCLNELYTVVTEIEEIATPLKPGMIVCGTYWLTGRLI